MSQLQNGEWRLKSRPQGMVKETDFEFVEVPLAPIGTGEILVKNMFLSFDPAQRGRLNDVKSYVAPQQIGEVMGATAVGEVIESNSDAFKPGDLVRGGLGWQQYAVVVEGSPIFNTLTKVPDGVAPELVLGVLGGTGLTAYFGLLKIGEFKPGDVVVVSGAAGATGSVVGQIARIKGAKKVIGIAGGEKCSWLTNDLGFDVAIDYKSENVGKRLREECRDSIDVYFDNVGGDILDAALVNMALNGRVVICGGISQYNEAGRPQRGPVNYLQLIVKRLTMRGFLVSDHVAEAPAAIAEMSGWIETGELKQASDIQEGIENTPRTFLRLFEGKNRGKQLLKI